MIEAVRLASGAALALFGLKFIGENAERGAGDERFLGFLRARIKTNLGGYTFGFLTASVLQSSAAASVVAASLAEKNAMSFWRAAWFISGANVGSTVTSHLLSSSEYLGAIICLILLIIGLTLRVCKSIVLKSVGESLIGASVLFFASDVVKESVGRFREEKWFVLLFLGNREWLLFLNGLFLAAIFQSSSAVSLVAIALASQNALPFYNAAFLILGANIGSCAPVLIVTANKNAEGRSAATFALFMNFVGALFLYPTIVAFKGLFVGFFSSFPSVPKAVAFFNTFFNLVAALLALPLTRFAMIARVKRRRKAG